MLFCVFSYILQFVPYNYIMKNENIEIVSSGKIEDIIYFVRKGDTISLIAEKFIVDKNMILKDNDLNEDDKIHEGDILWIRKKNSFYHIVKPLDTLSKIAAQYNVSVEHIQKLNGVQQIFIGQKLYL